MVAYYGTTTGEKKFGSTKSVLLVTKGSPVVGTLVSQLIQSKRNVRSHISRRFAVMVAPLQCE